MEGHRDIRTHHSQHPKGGDSPSLQENIKNKLETMSYHTTSPNRAHALSFFHPPLKRESQSPFARPLSPLLKKIIPLAKLAECKKKQGLY